jgi:hypothetical protein
MPFSPQKALVACADPALRIHLIGILRQHLVGLSEGSKIETGDRSLVIFEAHDVESAQPHGQTVDLAVVQANLYHRGTAPNGSRPMPFGWKLVQEWQRKRPERPVIVVLEDDALLNSVQATANAWPMKLDLNSDLEKTIATILAKISAPTAVPDRPETQPSRTDCATIEIDLTSLHSPCYRVTIHQGHRKRTLVPRETQDFQVSSRKVKDLLGRTTRLGDAAEWEADFRSIGEQLFDAIAQGKFAIHLAEAKGVCGTRMDAMRIRFTIGTDVYGLPFEAMYDEDLGRYLVLTSSLARRVANSSRTETLASPLRPPLNILVIKAEVGSDDYVRAAGHDQVWDAFVQDHRFEILENVATECDDLQALPRLLGTYNKEHLLGRITVISKEHLAEFDGSFSGLIRRNLTSTGTKYDIVHFAGHSVFVSGYPDSHARGFLILPGRKDAERLDMATFGDWLQQGEAKLVYLSSCNSSEADAAFTLARCGVPAVIGFRWDLDDRLAAKYAKKFYEKLFLKTLCVDKAFLAARCSIHKKYMKDRIWAAPILLIQNDDWDASLDASTLQPVHETFPNA